MRAAGEDKPGASVTGRSSDPLTPGNGPRDRSRPPQSCDAACTVYVAVSAIVGCEVDVHTDGEPDEFNKPRDHTSRTRPLIRWVQIEEFS